MNRQSSLARLRDITSELKDEPVSIRIDRTGNGNLEVELISQDAEWSRVWNSSFRAFAFLENRLGAILTIQGVPRDRWRRQFAFCELYGAYDRDKSPLMIAAQQGDARAVGQILESVGTDTINARGPLGMTALMYGASQGHQFIVKVLIQHGASASIYYDEFTPLEAALGGGPELVSLLLSAGADVNARNRYGETPLMYAAASNDARIVGMLLDAGADTAPRNHDGQTALDWAIRNKRAEIVKLLESTESTGTDKV